MSTEPGLSCDHQVSTRPGLHHCNMAWGKKTQRFKKGGPTWNLFGAVGSLNVFNSPCCDVGSASTALFLHWAKKVLRLLLFKNSIYFLFAQQFHDILPSGSSALDAKSRANVTFLKGYKQLKTLIDFDSNTNRSHERLISYSRKRKCERNDMFRWTVWHVKLAAVKAL